MRVQRSLSHLLILTITATTLGACGVPDEGPDDNNGDVVVVLPDEDMSSPSGDMHTPSQDMSSPKEDMGRPATEDMATPGEEDMASAPDMAPEVDMAPPPEVALADGVQIRTLEAYQTIRTDLLASTPEVPLIANRETLVRLHVDTAPGWRSQQVTGVLTVDDGSAPAYELRETKQLSGPSTDSDRSSIFEFTLPASAVTMDLSLAAHIEGEGSVAVDSGVVHEAIFPRDGSLMRAPVEDQTGKLEVVIVPIRYNSDGSGRMPDTSPAQMQKFQDSLNALYPMTEVDFSVRAPIDWNSRLDFGDINVALRSLKMQDGKDNAYYYGMISPATDFNTYCSRRCTTGQSFTVSNANASSYRVGTGVGFSGDRWVWTFMHELGHMHGRGHAPCDVTWDPDRNYPYAGGKTGVHGWDRRTDSFITPQSHTDFMGYCDTLWVSDYTYLGIKARMEDAWALQRGRSLQAPRSYHVLSWSFDEAPYWLQDIEDRAPYTGEEALVIARDGEGNELARQSAHIARQSHDGSIIALVEALPDGTSAIALETARGEVIYAPSPR
ncbi:MAG: hypothetical protein VYE40_07530 [Myxococcota bacterium]|nr:hypothetical protein [Myxococcota bacterium]